MAPLTTTEKIHLAWSIVSLAILAYYMARADRRSADIADESRLTHAKIRGTYED